jgi:ATP-dependent DNA helicase RecG
LSEQASITPTDERLIALIDDLRKLPTELEWLEFKENDALPERIGKTVSALANSACISGEPKAYMIWGVNDESHAVVGTVFNPKKPQKGNEPLELWLAKSLSPSPAFRFLPADHPDGRVVVLEIPAANMVPVKFGSVAYIRVGNTTPKLSDYPQREADLVSKLRPFVWEHSVAEAFISPEDVLAKLDIESYFTLMGQGRPTSSDQVFERLKEERLIAKDVGGRWNILNLGAILFGERLANFESTVGKPLRVIQYDGETRLKTKKIQEGTKGYAAGFRGALAFIDGLLPAEEVIEAGIRTSKRTYPQIAIRELVANALIHQDMTVTGTGPKVEIFDSRIEISNPGVPVTDMLNKLFGAPPRSRNEHMGRLMRRMGICEELGAGLVRVITEVEQYRLPAPRFDTIDGNTRVIFYGPQPYNALDRLSRLRICYQHACLMSHSGKPMTNTSLRNRLGVGDDYVAPVSRLIREALNEQIIKPADPTKPKGNYLPWWAA